jgi:hypothetical protein
MLLSQLALRSALVRISYKAWLSFKNRIGIPRELGLTGDLLFGDPPDKKRLS